MPKKRSRPNSDWNCRELLDAKAVNTDGESRCEFCGTRIRWIHILEHDDWHRPIETGCCCAARLCFEYDAKSAERNAKNRLGRYSRFIESRRWNRSNTNPANVWRWVKLPDGRRVRVTIFFKSGKYGIYIVNKENDDDKFCPWDRYSSKDDAMAVAFEVIENAK